MTQALRTLRRLASKPPAKARPAPTSSPEPWRLELETWSEEDRYAWEERVAIMTVVGGIPDEEAERAAFLDVSLYRTATR